MPLIRLLLLLSLLNTGWMISTNVNASTVAKNVQFRHLTVEDGLSQETVYNITQDNKGFMWFATSEGANRFDGYRVKTYLHDPKNVNSISHDWIWTIFQDSQGRMWFGTDGGGLNLLLEDGHSFVHYKHQPNNKTSLSSDIVRAIVETDNGKLLLGTEHGLDYFDPASGQVERITLEQNDEMSPIKVRDVLLGQHNHVWIATDGNGLFQLDLSRRTVQKYFNQHDGKPFGTNRIRSIFESLDGIVWIGTYDKGIYRLNPRTGFIKHYDKGSGHGLNNNFIRDITQDHLGIIWFASDNGLFEYRSDIDTFVHYANVPGVPSSLISRRTLSLYQDSGGILWVGTYSGISKWNYQTSSFELYRSKKDVPFSLKSNTILSFVENSKGQIWVGTYDGLYLFDELTGKFTYFGKEQGVIDLRITSLEIIDGTLWVGTFGGSLIQMDVTTNRVVKVFQHDQQDESGLANGGITRLAQDSKGNLWIAHFGGGLSVLKPKLQSFVHYRHNENDENSINSNKVVYVTVSRNDEVWFSTLGNGVGRLIPSNGEVKRYRKEAANPFSIASDTIWVISEDRQSNLWFGSQGKGLLKLSANMRRKENPEFEQVSRLDGLKSNVIYGIIEDERGELWLSSNRGLTRYFPSRKIMRHYGVFHGLQSYEFNAGASYKTSSGKLYFGGSNGFNAFYPAEIIHNEHPPKIALTDIRIVNESLTRGKSIEKATPLTLSAEDYVVSFEFAALDYASPTENKYKYRLVGYEDNWIDAGVNRYATYTNLPHGTYTFKVIGSNNDGVWNEDGVELNVEVLPPWFLSRWAYLSYLLMVLLFCAFGYYIHLHRIKQERKNSEVLEEQINQKTEQLLERSFKLEERNLELKSLNKQLQEASYTDVTTGLPNRRFVSDYMNKITKNLERRLEKMSLSDILAHHHPLFIILIDISNFKSTNEIMGPDFGDQVLSETADLLKSLCRESDMLARWGSDSFILVGETEKADYIKVLVKRLLEKVNNLKIVSENHKLDLEASAGLVYYPFSVSQSELFSWEQVLSIAEKAQSIAKLKGDIWASIQPGQLGLTRTDYKRIILDPEAMAEQQAIYLIFSSNENSSVDA